MVGVQTNKQQTTTTENAKVEASLNLRLAESGAKKDRRPSRQVPGKRRLTWTLRRPESSAVPEENVAVHMERHRPFQKFWGWN